MRQPSTQRAEKDEYGLNEQQRAFVRHFVESGDSTGAAKNAGYSKDSAWVRAYELQRNPKVINAIQAETGKRIGQLAPLAVSVIQELATSAQSAYVRLQAAQDLLDRAGFKPPDRVDHRVDANLTVNLDLSGATHSKAIEHGGGGKTPK